MMPWEDDDLISETAEWFRTLKKQLSISPLASREEYLKHMQDEDVMPPSSKAEH